MWWLLLACVSPAPEGPPAAAAPLDVRSLSYPAHYLAARLAGDAARVTCALPPGEDPPHWQPPGALVAEIAGADLIVANGAGFEAWVATASLPAARLVDSAAGVELVTIEGATHSHGAAGEHSHAGVDPHTWSDPRTYLAQARNVAAALGAARPEAAPAVGGALAALAADLEALDARLAAALAPAAGAPLFANHPAYNYLARRYGLTLRSFDFDPATPPDPAALADFLEAIEGVEAPLLFWEQAPSPAARAAFPDRVRHVALDPLEQPAGGRYDYLEAAAANAAALEALF